MDTLKLPKIRTGPGDTMLYLPFHEKGLEKIPGWQGD
jgi:hypothetical protein